MRIIEARNVGEALQIGSKLMRETPEAGSRNGPVKVLRSPLSTEYLKPTERVVFSRSRNANPFFHLMESLWMLAGRNDVAFPEMFNSKFGQFSDDGDTFNAAYGYRWRHHFGKDQLNIIVDELRKNPESRQCVLQMWDPSDLDKETKDKACNTAAYFQIADGRLNMMVSNRSNDMIWGAYGANAVHFSVLLEYLASSINVEVGTYHQVSMNTHVYERHWPLLEEDHATSHYEDGFVEPYPLMTVPKSDWDLDLYNFMSNFGNQYRDPFFREVAEPMFQSWRTFQRLKGQEHRYLATLDQVRHIKASDWRLACTIWLEDHQERFAR
jgi:thymidylate synthase